jgi:hypothetical protein
MKQREALGVAIAAATMLFGAFVLPATRADAAAVVFVVNSTADRDDVAVDGTCQTTVAGECTLRAALTEANAVTTSPVLVQFAIPGAGVHKISVGSRLPLINNGTAGITIDGFSQPGSAANTSALTDNAVRLIEIVGTGPNGIDGLVLLGSNNVIRGVAIHGFKRALRMTGADAQFNQVTGNIIGLLPNGDFDPTYADVPGSPCVDVNNGASRNRIGMPGTANRNVISGCYEKGVTFYNQFTWKKSVQNNLIGLDPTGTKRRGSQSMGVDINWSANGTIIGGTALQERNVISGNVNSGVEISHGTGTINNQVIGNFIGTDPTGNSASPETVNNQVGVRLEGKPNCGTSACPPDESKETVSDNVIVNSGWGGILVDKGTHDSTITRNLVGRTLNGTIVGNGTFGIRLAAGATHITVGPANTVDGNHPGVQISPFGSQPQSDVFSPTQFNKITNNAVTSTGGLGIDIVPSGTVNQNGSGDPGLQQGIDVPALTLQAPNISATTCAGCTVELFAAGAAAGAFGPGTSFIATAVAGSDGTASFAPPAGGWPALVTATTTTPQGSTSEFAANTASTDSPPPNQVTVTSLSPRALGQSATNRDVKVNGTGFASGSTVTFSGAGITVKSVVFTSASLLTVKVSVASDAPAGPGSVSVTVPGNSPSTCSGCFTVNAGPAVTSVSPTSVARGQATTVDILGSTFNSGVTVTISGTGVTVGTVTRVDATHLRVVLTVAATATTGPCSLTITNTDAGKVIATDAVTVT